MSDEKKTGISLRFVREFDAEADAKAWDRLKALGPVVEGPVRLRRELRVRDRVLDGRHLMQPRHTDPRFADDVLS